MNKWSAPTARVVTSILACLLLVSCDSSSGLIPDTYSSSTLAANLGVETTVPVIAMSDLPSKLKCPVSDINEETGYTFDDSIECVDGWAVGLPKEITDKLTGESEIEGNWVLARTTSGWKVAGTCHLYHPIDSSGVWCSPIDSSEVDTSLLPPMNVQCVLWSASRWSDTIGETGCPNPED